MSRAKLSDEEKKARNRERCRRWRERNPEKVAAYSAAYRAANPDYYAAYRAANPEKVAACNAAYNAANKEKRAAYKAAYNATKQGRAVKLVNNYNHDDKNRGFDTSNNVTAEWMEENIFSGQSCIYCGDSEWEHLGCDRIDNRKPHTPENVVCSCGLCNMERSDNFSVEEFKEYRELHPRTLGSTIEKNWEFSELPNGLKAIKKKSAAAS